MPVKIINGWQVSQISCQKGYKMAKHMKVLIREVTEPTQVGNSMSTYFTWFNGKFSIYRQRYYGKFDEVLSISAKRWDKVQVNCPVVSEADVFVMTPPKDHVALAAWSRGFSAKMRQNNLDEMVAKVKAKKRWSSPHGCDIPSASLFKSENCAVAYRAVMEGWKGVPYLWYASEDATPEEMTDLINIAVGENALPLYT